MKKLHISQEKVDLLIERLVDQIRFSGKNYSCVVGILDGALNVSVPIANALNLPHRSIKISYYDGEQLRDSPVVKGDFVWIPNMLLVDDLIDTGSTILFFKQNFGEADVAVLYLGAKNLHNLTPEYFGEEKPDEWIVFPWEC